MGGFFEFWNGLGRNSRAGLAAGCVFVLATLIGAGWWVLRMDYDVLFSRLKPQDAAAMVAELDKMKTPYRLADEGTTILAEAAHVHATRLKLMGREMPLHGAVGFELFNNADFGMTEFAQKINYQRALQGEITRTILSLGEVRDARVHLVLPEEGLFKRATSKAKAAITLTLNPGLSLAPQQIAGVQKLVSAAVPGVSSEDVTIVDQRGVALTRAVVAGNEGASGSIRLDLKKETEELLVRKATEVLERAFGPGNAIASVDATLNLDQVRTTTEDVLGVPSRSGQGMTGVLVRERETSREGAAPLETRLADARSGTNQRETDYQAGRRVEQVVSQPGAVRRLQLVAVVNRPLEAEQIGQLKVLLGAAVGAVPERGDVVVVQSLVSFEPKSVVHDGAPPVESSPPARLGAAAAVPAARAIAVPVAPWDFVLGAALLALLLGAAAWVWRGRQAPVTPALSEQEREVLLQQVRAWLTQPEKRA